MRTVPTRFSVAIVLLLSVVWPARADWSTVLEAEEASTPRLPAHIVDAAGASGQKAVEMSGCEASALDHSSASVLGSTTLSLNIPSDGDYTLWVRLQWHCTCARELRFTLSAKDFTNATVGRGGDPTLIASLDAPRVWHWKRLGKATFAAGTQTLTFIQAGHQTLVDCVAISRSQDYTPPGYEGEKRTFSLLAPTAAWSPATDKTRYQALDPRRKWSSFRLALSVAPAPAAEHPSETGIGFCTQDDGSGYLLLLSRSSADTLRLSFSREDAGASAKMLGQKEVSDKAQWHTVGMSKNGSTFSISLDGLHALTIEDDRYPEGTLRLVQRGDVEGSIEDMDAHDLFSQVELFTGGAREWKKMSGTWKPTPDDSLNAAGTPLMGSGQQLALISAPWKLGDQYSVETQIRPLEGSAGIAFDVRENGEGYAASVGTTPGGAAGQALQIVRFGAAGLRTLWTADVSARSNQWHTLRVQRNGNTVAVGLDDLPPSRFALSTSALNTAVGLWVSPGGNGLFAVTKALDYAETNAYQFVYGPSYDRRALALWQEKEGLFECRDHPDRLTCQTQPPGDRVLLEFRPKMSSNLEFSLLIGRTLRRNTATPAENTALPDVMLPVLPNDPRLVLRLTGPPGTPAYEASIDIGTLRDITLCRDGRVIGHKTFDVARRLPEDRFFFRSVNGVLEAGISGGGTVTATEDTLKTPAPGFTVSMRIEHAKQGEQLVVLETEVKEIYPSLEEQK